MMFGQPSLDTKVKALKEPGLAARLSCPLMPAIRIDFVLRGGGVGRKET
jgi:hypothetical protein